MTDINWSFGKIWNDSLEMREEKPLTPRENMWASELGGAYLDRYLKMKAVPMTNPPNPRSLRKFEAGNLMEWVVGLILKRAGILTTSQEWVKYQYTFPYRLSVTGKLDYLAGGKPNYDTAAIKDLGLPTLFDRATDAIVQYFQEKYPEGLKPTILEIKSCSSFTYEKYEKGIADPKHVLQAFHYLIAKDMPEAHIVYICKDDLRICEIGVFNNPETEALYKTDIDNMTNFIKKNIQPDKEPEILFDGRFSQNWKVSYSSYLTKLYGYKNQMEYEEKYKPMIASWNRTFGRMVNKDKMTPLNLATIKEIEKTFPNIYELVAKAQEGVKTE